jgi:integrase
MFESWCRQYSRVPFPADPETVLLYLTDLIHQGKKLTTANRRKCAIAYEHRLRGTDSPVTQEVKRMLCGAQRLMAEKPRQMVPITVGQLSEMSGQLERLNKFTAWRDRALLVLGFASALRRSNLAALRLADIEFRKEGLAIGVGREKNDQQGHGRLLGAPRGHHRATCPVRTMRDWLKRRGEMPGPLFPRQRRDAGCLDGDSVTRIVKTCVRMIGLDAKQYGAHSLRAGFITEAGLASVGELQIAKQTGHRSMAVLRRYFRPQDLFRGNAGAMLGL